MSRDTTVRAPQMHWAALLGMGSHLLAYWPVGLKG